MLNRRSFFGRVFAVVSVMLSPFALFQRNTAKAAYIPSTTLRSEEHFSIEALIRQEATEAFAKREDELFVSGHVLPMGDYMARVLSSQLSEDGHTLNVAMQIDTPLRLIHERITVGFAPETSVGFKPLHAETHSDGGYIVPDDVAAEIRKHWSNRPNGR